LVADLVANYFVVSHLVSFKVDNSKTFDQAASPKELTNQKVYGTMAGLKNRYYPELTNQKV
jgi:hypothetical protein